MALEHLSDVPWMVVASQAPLEAEAAPLVVPIVCAQPSDPDHLWWPATGGSSMVHEVTRARAEEEIEDGNWSWLEKPLPWQSGTIYLYTGTEPLLRLRESEVMAKLRGLAVEALGAAEAARTPAEVLRHLERAARANLDDPAIRLSMLAVARGQVTLAVLSLLCERIHEMPRDALDRGYASLARSYPKLAEQVRRDPDGMKYASPSQGTSRGQGPHFFQTMRMSA